MNDKEIIKTQQELIDLLYSQVVDLSMMSKIELGDDVIEEINRLKFMNEEPDPIMDEFDKTLKMLHESTHDGKIRESILLVQRYKTEYLDNKKQR